MRTVVKWAPVTIGTRLSEEVLPGPRCCTRLMWKPFIGFVCDDERRNHHEL